MDNLREFKLSWSGSVFMCVNTQKVVIIPDKYEEGQIFRFGDCFIEIGYKGLSGRFGGRQKYLGKPFKYDILKMEKFIEEVLKPKFSSSNEIEVTQTVIRRKEVEGLI